MSISGMGMFDFLTNSPISGIMCPTILVALNRLLSFNITIGCLSPTTFVLKKKSTSCTEFDVTNFASSFTEQNNVRCVDAFTWSSLSSVFVPSLLSYNGITTMPYCDQPVHIHMMKEEDKIATFGYVI